MGWGCLQLPTPQGQDRSTQALEGEEPLAPEPWGLEGSGACSSGRDTARPRASGGAVPNPRGLYLRRVEDGVGEGRGGGVDGVSLSPALEGMSEMPDGVGVPSAGAQMGKLRKSPKQRPQSR